MNSNVFCKTRMSTGEMYGSRARVKKLAFVCGGTAGSIILRDGGASGAILLDLATSADGTYKEFDIPENGIVFSTNLHATLTNVTSLTAVLG